MIQRAAIILIDNDQVALIQRVRGGKTYYVFPGGGIEDGETPEKAAQREAIEELGLEVETGSCVYEEIFERRAFYFQAKQIGGIFGTGTGEEYTTLKPERGSHKAVWMPLEMLPTIRLYPEELAIKIPLMNREEICDIKRIDFRKANTKPSEK